LIGCEEKREEAKNDVSKASVYTPKEGDWYERISDRKRFIVLKAGKGDELNKFAEMNYRKSDTSYMERRTFYYESDVWDMTINSRILCVWFSERIHCMKSQGENNLCFRVTLLHGVAPWIF